MLLGVDIGNTTISCGLFRGARLARRFDVPTAQPALLTRHLRGARVQRAIVCSVVPRATAAVARILRAAGVSAIRIVGRDLRVPLRNRYRRPRQVGDDRLVGAYAAWRAYRRTCIICDFGTAITIDIVTRAGDYLGGIIAPGMQISLDALATRTALLPTVALRQPPELLGRDTASSIRSGILYGCAALCDGLVAQLKRRYAPTALVVATGGASKLVCRHTRQIDVVRPNLVLDGLLLLSQ